jgi:hypothetical protein
MSLWLNSSTVAVLRPLRFPLGKVLAESIRDVGPDKRLVASEAERGGDLLEIFDDVIGQTEVDQGFCDDAKLPVREVPLKSAF